MKSKTLLAYAGLCALAIAGGLLAGYLTFHPRPPRPVTEAVLLDERLEERHAEHLALALVDARGEELVDVVAEQVPVQERPPAVRLHVQLDRRLLLGFAGEDLGDDALHLAAVALVEQAGTPLGDRVAGDDQPGEV